MMILQSSIIFAIIAAISTSDVGLKTPEIIENHGYVAETHEVTTSDGYILTVHRIPNGINNTGATSKPVAFLMHGLISSSADYVNMGPNLSLGFLLADAGYDVWLGNARGNGYSRNHTTLDVKADAEKFFDFSWHEIGKIDVAEMIDHILNVTNQDSLQYVGHSQGCTAFFVLMSTRPEYNKKIKLASLMAPAAFLAHRPFGLISEICKYYELATKVVHNWKVYEVPYVEQIREFATAHCGDPEYEDFCRDMLAVIGGEVLPELLDTDMIPVIGTNAPSNCAIKQALHFCQEIRNGGFDMYDYGAEKNQELYGSDKPPAYELGKISAPVGIYYAKDDVTVPDVDVRTLMSQLPNINNEWYVEYPGYNHISFVFAKKNNELVYDELIRRINEKNV